MRTDESVGNGAGSVGAGAAEAFVIKRSPQRSVRVVAAEGGGRLVVKRFHGELGLPLGIGRLPGTGMLRGLRDAARARNEHELLARLFASGAPVPRPLELRSSPEGGHEVVMEWVPDSVSLLAVLAGEVPPPAPPRDLARRLAQLLAGLQARGLDHPDLHAGNVLVDPRGELVAVDFHKARLVDELDPGALESHLVQLCAGTREFVGRTVRRRFLTEWSAALPGRLARQLPRSGSRSAPELGALARRVERRARALRRRVVLHRQARWTRAGTAVEPLAAPAGPGWIRVGADPARLEQLLRSAGSSSSGTAGLPRELLIIGPEGPGLLALWLAAARLHEHRVPCAAPLALATGPRPWLALELPLGARPVEAGELDPARDRLAACLADRGLRAELAREHVWMARDPALSGPARPLLVPGGGFGLA